MHSGEEKSGVSFIAYTPVTYTRKGSENSMIITYLLYILIISVAMVVGLNLVDKLRTKAIREGNKIPISEETKFVSVLYVIGSSLWSLLYYLFMSEDRIEMVNKEISDVSIFLKIFQGLFLLNIAGFLAMLAFVGPISIPLILLRNKLMRMYRLDSEQRTIDLIVTCLLISNVLITGFFLIAEYILLLKH